MTNMQPDVSRFTIYRQLSGDEKRRNEAIDIMHLLLRLHEFLKLDDVLYGPEPPDFVICNQEKQIGVELTKLNPKIFENGGFMKRGEFKSFKAEVAQKTVGEDVFNWGKFTLRESLDALANHLGQKQRKAETWHQLFPECWLLIQIASGSPFGEIVASEQNMHVQSISGMELEFNNYVAKITSCIHELCQRKTPFDYVIPFWRENFLAFPTSPANPHHLPVPSNEILNHGASIPDSFLDRKRGSETTIRHRQFNFVR